MTSTAISVSEVRQLATALFLRMEKAGIDRIVIDETNYWKVFPADLFRSSGPEPVLGDVDDDLADLRRDDCARTTDALWHALNHLSGVISVMAAADLGATADAPSGGRVSS